jgi:hypothetical protein
MLSGHADTRTVDVLTTLFSFRLHQKRLPLFPNFICWFSRFDTDGDQLFVVVERFVDATVIFAIIFFVVVLNREDDPTTLC